MLPIAIGDQRRPTNGGDGGVNTGWIDEEKGWSCVRRIVFKNRAMSRRWAEAVVRRTYYLVVIR